MHVHVRTKRPSGVDLAEDPARPMAFAALCVLIALLLLVKYYPLRPTTFVMSQYLWTVEVGNLRRTVVSSMAGLAWAGDPARFLPVVDLVSLIQMAGLALALAWGATRLAGRPVPRLALLLVLCSGAASHLLATRGSQDGFAVLTLIGFAAALAAGRALPAVLLAALAVAIHEASFVYAASLCGLQLLLGEEGVPAGWRDIGRRLAGRQGRAVLASGVAAGITAVIAVAGPHMPPGFVEASCASHRWIASVGDPAVARNLPVETWAQDWDGSCGLQFKTFTAPLGFALRSLPVGMLFAPVALVALALALRARLPVPVRLGVVASLLLPALLPLVATDVTRFWSYMNLIALYGLVLMEPHLRGFGRVSPRGLVGIVLVLWVPIAIGIDQWPTGWPQPPSALPETVSLRLPTFRDVFCAASQQGLCGRPTTDFH